MEESGRMPEKGKEQSSLAAACYEWVEALITALTAVMILFVFLFRVNIGVIGDSMKPNYQEGFRVFVSCADHNLSRGDVVVIDSNATKLNERIIKRVIATEGQKVNINFETGIVSVDGKELDESDYIRNGITTNQSDLKFPQTVPPGHIFVLGDNRPVSNDSRSSDIGMIDRRYVIGKVDFLLKPFRGFTRV
jgi:signal peptidase I